MKKNCILLFAMTLIIAFCFTLSVMAKKRSYLGYQYNDPDGSILKKELNFETVSAQYVPKLRRRDDYIYSSIALNEHFKNSIIYLNGFGSDVCENWDEYFEGKDSLLILKYNRDKEYKFDLYYSYSMTESDVDKIENLDKVIKEYLLPNISIPNNCELSICCFSDYDSHKRVKVFSVKNGVVLGKAAIAKKQAAKEQAAYNQLCKKYGKKYADAAWNGRIIVGMPEELLKKMYYCVLRYQSGSSKKYDSAAAGAIIWVRNGRVSSISWY